MLKNQYGNPFYLIIDKTNEYMEKSNENMYSMLVPTYENKKIIKKYEELQIKIKDLVRSVTATQMIMIEDI